MVKVKVFDAPVHPLAVGVTVTVAVTGTVPVLTGLKAGIFPVPAEASPIVVLSFNQLYEVPATVPVNVIVWVICPLHRVWFAISFTTGIGLAVIVKLAMLPSQPVEVGITVILATTGLVVVLTAVKAGKSPRPELPIPIAAFELVHE